MSDWKQDFRKHMIDLLVKKGTPLSDNPSFWGWIADDYQEIRKVIKSREIDYVGTEIKDSEWQTGDTFTQETRYGVDVTIKFTDGGSSIKVRYDGMLGDLILDLMREIAAS